MYGLLGYILKLDLIRDLLINLVLRCENYGMRVDEISADGQFYKLSVRSKIGKLLTILQVQKNVWERCKKQEKTDQVKQFTQINDIGSVKDFSYVAKYVSYFMPTTANEQICGPIVVYGCKNKTSQVIYTPTNINNLIKSNNQETKNKKDNEQEEDIDRDLLQYLPNEVLDLMDEESRKQLINIGKQLPNRKENQSDFNLTDSFINDLQCNDTSNVETIGKIMSKQPSCEPWKMLPLTIKKCKILWMLLK